eukprot:2987156-Prymnesium_polylepis.1
MPGITEHEQVLVDSSNLMVERSLVLAGRHLQAQAASASSTQLTVTKGLTLGRNGGDTSPSGRSPSCVRSH